jgi:hypothetical protein
MIASAKGKRFLEYISPIYEQSIIMQAILEAIGAEWDDVDRLTDEVFAQLFPQTATWGIVYWERLVGIPRNDSLSIEQRRARVLTRMQTRWPVTKSRLEQIVNQFVSSKDARIQERYADYSFDIILPFGGFDYSEVTRLIEEVKPAHLAASYEARAKELALVIATRPRSWHFDYPLTNILRTATKPGKSLPSSLQIHSRDRTWKFGYPLANTFYPQGVRGKITESTLEMQAQSRVFLFEYPLCGTFATGEVSM